MKPVYGVDGGNLTFEFAKSRGAIHFHTVLRMMNEHLKRCQRALQLYAENVDESMRKVNNFISHTYNHRCHIGRLVLSDPLSVMNFFVERTKRTNTFQSIRRK